MRSRYGVSPPRKNGKPAPSGARRERDLRVLAGVEERLAEPRLGARGGTHER